MSISRTDLELVQRHVANSETRVDNQRKAIAILAARGQPLQHARRLLRLFEVTRQAHIDHLAQLEEILARQSRPYGSSGVGEHRHQGSGERRAH
jgi:hypothetical protein